MGLLYVFPVSLEEEGFAEIKDQTLTLKTYGLPYIFWGYALAILMVIIFMFLAIKAPIFKLIELGDDIDAFLGYFLLTFIGLLPILLFSFFFYEKRIIKETNELILEYRLFGLKFFTKRYHLAKENPYQIAPYLSSPNIARMKGGEESQGFQNKGYFLLTARTDKGKAIFIDRHSRKVDLQKMEDLLKMIP